MGASRPLECSDAGNSVWHLKRFCDGNNEDFEEFALTLCFEEALAGRSPGAGAAAPAQKVVGRLAPSGDGIGTPPDGSRSASAVELDGELTKVALRLEHRDSGGELCVYRSERFVAEGDGQFRGVWMCGARTGRFAAARRKSPDEPRKRKSACRRKADAEIKSKRFFNDLKDELLILERLGWTERRWKEESKLEKGRAILNELRRELENILAQLGLAFHPHTPWLQRVESGIQEARRRGSPELLRQLRAVDCSASAPTGDLRSDWHTLFEIQRHFCALPPFRATKYLEPSNVRHSLRCAEVTNRSFFEGGRYIGGARQLCGSLLPCRRGGRAGSPDAAEELRAECVAGDRGIDEAFDVQIQLVIRAGCSEFIWEPGADVKLHFDDRVYYEQAHVWSEEKRTRRHNNGRSPCDMARKLREFEDLLTGGRREQVYEEDFEFVEMTARGESGAAEGVPAFLAHSVTGGVADSRELLGRQGPVRGWTCRPKALNLGPLFKTRLAGYRHHRTREIEWGPGPQLYWEEGDRPLRLLRMSQEPVRVRFCRREGPYGFHLQDTRAGGGVEVVEVVEGSPADARGVVVGRTVKRLCFDGRTEDVRQWTRSEIEDALARAPERFLVEFGKGDTEERRHAPLGDAGMAILMDERFMRGFLHELGHSFEEPTPLASGAAGLFDQEGWAGVFPGLEALAATAAQEGARAPAAAAQPRRTLELQRQVTPEAAPRRSLSPMRVPLPTASLQPGGDEGSLCAAKLCQNWGQLIQARSNLAALNGQDGVRAETAMMEFTPPWLGTFGPAVGYPLSASAGWHRWWTP